MNVLKLRAAIVAALLTASPLAAQAAASEQQNLEELRNTVVNLLQVLVDQGVMTREKAAQLVRQAQDKAAADAAASAKRDEGAVRVPYVPQIVKDEISKQVADEVKPAVVEGVVQQAKAEGWGVPGAMPEWLSRVRVSGDVRVRGQSDLYSSDNAPTASVYLDHNAINAAGGLQAAGQNAFLNVTHDQERLRVRARFGAEVEATPDWHVGVRVATGSSTDPSSESQTLGTTAARYNVGFDQAYIRYQHDDASKFRLVTVSAGRFANPWLSPTELIFARDLTFEGVAYTGRTSFGQGSGADRSAGFLTLGAFPVQFVPLASNRSKWLLAAQLGGDLHFTSADTLRAAIGYYDFQHMAGVYNTIPDLGLYNYTAPQFLRYGNTVFNIANSSTNSDARLYALAANFRLVDLAASYAHSTGRYSVGLNAQAVKNIGYNVNDVYNRTGITQSARNKGYVVDAGFGDPDPAARAFAWRATFGYRYVQRDAVLDAWTDADFHEGGTNAQGYYLVGDLGLAKNVWLRLRYLAANEIDGPQDLNGQPVTGAKYGVDIIQLDLNARF